MNNLPNLPKWPRFLPYPMAWVRSVAVTVSYVLFAEAGLFNPLEDDGRITKGEVATVFAWLVVAWVLQLFVFTFIHYLIMTGIELLLKVIPEEPEFFAAVRDWLAERRTDSHWQEGRNAVFNFAASLFLNLLIISFFPGGNSGSRFDDLIYGVMAWLLMPVTMAYLYYWEMGAAIKQKKAKKTRAKPAAKMPKSIVPAASVPVEQGNQASPQPLAEGMARVKPPNVLGNGWYVFRNGQAVGPFSTKEELKLFRITARTNVKREGATEWTRAGLIPELEDYLSD